MKDEILSLESDFANNEYFGTNVWTEEKYRVLSGNTPVLISAPHSVNQLRGDDVRDAEKFTGSLARYLSSATGSYAIFQLFTHADPNFDSDHNYKNGIINLVEVNNIKLLIDIHSSTFKDDTDIDIVTDNRITLLGNSNIIDSLKEIAIKNNIKVYTPIKIKDEIEKINITVEQLKNVFENATKNRMYKNQGNSRFIQCSQNIKVTGIGDEENKTYKIVQIEINGEKLLDENTNPLDNSKTFTATIDPYIGKGEQGFEVLKDISKTKILINGKGVKINDLFKDSLLSYAQNPPQNPEYPKAIMVDL